VIVVYEGAGTGDPTREGIQAFLTWAGLSWRGVGPADLTRENLVDVDAVYWPGGWAWPYVRDVTPEGKQAVRDVVARGGAGEVPQVGVERLGEPGGRDARPRAQALLQRFEL